MTTKARQILNRFDNAFIGGSYVVNPELANDIDVCVHECDYYNDINSDGISVFESGWNKVSERHEKYPDIDHERLVAVYESLPWDGKKTNVLVIGAAYWPAYIGAVATMRNNPILYHSRTARVDLHRMLCQKVKDIFTGVA